MSLRDSAKINEASIRHCVSFFIFLSLYFSFIISLSTILLIVWVTYWILLNLFLFWIFLIFLHFLFMYFYSLFFYLCIFILLANVFQQPSCRFCLFVIFTMFLSFLLSDFLSVLYLCYNKSISFSYVQSNPENATNNSCSREIADVSLFTIVHIWSFIAFTTLNLILFF